MSAEMHETHETQVGNRSPLVSHTFPGRLIAADGLDGSGKSTHLELLHFWLQAEGHEVQVVQWKTSKLIKRAMKKGKAQGHMDPMLISVLQAADLAELHERDIVPALQRGAVVLADRYIYTALARDLARGVERGWVEDLYRFALRPDLSIYFQISAGESLERILSNRPRPNYFQAGMDLGLSSDRIASFRAFQQRILTEYEAMVQAYGMLLCDATLPPRQQQQLLRESVALVLPGES